MSAESSRQLVVFSLGEEEYALPIERVHEIIRYTEPRSATSASPWVRGVINLRGKIVPVYDLGARLGLGASGGQEANIVIADSGTDVAGVVVDDVDQVLTVSADQLDSMAGGGDEAIEGIAKIDDRLIVLLDPAGVFGTGAAVAA